MRKIEIGENDFDRQSKTVAKGKTVRKEMRIRENIPGSPYLTTEKKVTGNNIKSMTTVYKMAVVFLLLFSKFNITNFY